MNPGVAGRASGLGGGPRTQFHVFLFVGAVQDCSGHRIGGTGDLALVFSSHGVWGSDLNEVRVFASLGLATIVQWWGKGCCLGHGSPGSLESGTKYGLEETAKHSLCEWVGWE